MSTDLEHLLTTTLGNRADTVTTGPAWAGAPAPQRRRPPRWTGALLAAATVAAVAVVLVNLPADDGPTAPGTHSGSVTHVPSPTNDPTTSTPPSPTGSTCATRLPQQWADALRTSGLDLGSDLVMALSVSTDGTVVALRDRGPTPGAARDVVLVPRSGAPSVAYTVRDPDRFSVQTAVLYQSWLVVAETSDPRPPAGTVPGSSPMPDVTELLAVDLSNGDVIPIAAGTPSGGPYIDSATVLGGRVYWDQRAKYGAPTATIRSLSLPSRDYRTEYSGPAGNLTVNNVGIFDGARILAHRDVPAVVSAAVHGHLERLVSDGTAWTWAMGQRRIGWWQPGQAAPIYRSVPEGVLDFDNNPTGALAVSGPYVLTGPIRTAVLDMRTGALAPMPGSSSYGGHDRGQFGAPSGGGVTTGAAYFGTGHFVNGYWTDGAREVLRVDTNGLPGLHC